MATIDELNEALDDVLEFVREIYQGGQRSVYEVNAAGERRVLKLMREDMRERAEREVAIGRTFEHPHLSRVLDDELLEVTIGEEVFVYFTETFIEGEPLVSRTEPMEPCEALALGCQLLSAVSYLWDRHHVVHRDIKPINIMVKPDGDVVLLDIGVARHQDLTTLTNVAGDHGPGTIGYLAPEQLIPLKGRDLDFRADLFAIGIVMYQQLLGHLPFDPAAASYRTRLTAGLVTGLDNLASPLRELLERLLAARPHARFRLDKAREAFDAVAEALACS